MIVRRLVLSLVPYLQRPPMVWALAFYYRLAVQAAVWAVRGIPGVTAVYLSGSLARGEPVYGMSDIDLKILVRGPPDQTVARRIRSRLMALARVFPVLGSYREKGVFFERTLARDVDRFPLLRHLFDRDFYPDRLLWGEDVLGQEPLPEAGRHQLLLSYLWKAKYWLEKILVFAEEPRLSRCQRLYLAAKAADNLGRLMARVDRPVGGAAGVDAGFEHLKARLGVARGPAIDRLAEDRSRLFRGSALELDDLFPIVMEAIVELVTAIRRELDAGGQVADGPVARCVGDGWQPGPRVAARCLEAISEACPPGAGVRLAPPALLGVSALDRDDLERPIVVVTPPQPLGLQDVLRLRRVVHREILDRVQVLVRHGDEVFFPVHTEMLEHWLITAVEDQHALSLLHGGGRPLSVRSVALWERRLDLQLDELIRIAEDPELDGMSGQRRWGLCRAGLRSLAVLSSIRRGRFELVCDLPAAARCLERDGRLARDAAEAIAEPSRWDEPEVARRTPQLIGELAAAMAAGDPRSVTWPSHDGPRTGGLSVSVVVVTCNRADQLRQCLDALAEQTRTPDEIVVIDNGSTDHTREVVEGCAVEPRPRYLRESVRGYGRARNAGISAAAGEVVAFVDDDAVVSSRWLERLVAPLERDPRIGIVGGSIRTLDERRRDSVYRYHVASEGGVEC